MKKAIKNTINIIWSAILISFFLWIAVSWVDIISDNLSRNPQHADWNFIIVVGELVEGAAE